MTSPTASAVRMYFRVSSNVRRLALLNLQGGRRRGCPSTPAGLLRRLVRDDRGPFGPEPGGDPIVVLGRGEVASAVDE
jgi:hypothetical protein